MASQPPVPGLVEHLFRHQAGHLVATLGRIFGARHLDLAEEAVQEALLKALQLWPFHGVPANPSAWLVQAAKNAALDRLRRTASLRDKEPLLRSALEAAALRGPDEPLGDDDLAMMFMACHPELGAEARVALTLKTVAGFSVEEIARAFLAEKATIAQRLVRAKRRLREREVALELPPPAELPRRLSSVLAVIYLLFNEGYAAHGGPDLVRSDLCDEAIRLGGLLVARPDTALPAAHALQALMLLQAARLPARLGPGGELVLLADQDRDAWDRGRLQQGLRHLDLAATGSELTAYHLEAGIAAIHAIAPSFAATDWPQILDLYDRLLALVPSPVVRLNRAVALAQVAGPRPALAEIERLASEPALSRYYLLPATAGALRARAGEPAAAAAAYRAALACPCSQPERRFLERQLASVLEPRP